MRAVRISAFGGPEALRLEELPIPQPADEEALVRVLAAGVSPVDCKIRSGAFAGISGDRLPVVLGQDVSGTVELCGRAVRELDLGQPVFAFLPPGRGAYADYVLVREAEAAPKPRGLDHRTAAAVPLAATTAWQGLFDHGRLEAGQHVLIHGAAGGVGHIAVQLARAHGSIVHATAGADDLELVRELGALEVIDHAADRFEDRLSQMDLVLDVIGGATLERSLTVLKRGGRLVSTLAEPPPGRAEEHGVRALRFTAQPNAPQLALIGRLIDGGQIRVVVDRVFPLAEAADAHRYLEGRHRPGKVVLDVDPPAPDA